VHDVHDGQSREDGHHGPVPSNWCRKARLDGRMGTDGSSRTGGPLDQGHRRGSLDRQLLPLICGGGSELILLCKCQTCSTVVSDFVDVYDVFKNASRRLPDVMRVAQSWEKRIDSAGAMWLRRIGAKHWCKGFGLVESP